jgi:hypothetical protein
MLRGKRAVITGGGSGFGQALAVWLAREGVSRLLRPAPGGYPGNQHSDRGGGRDGARIPV